MNTSQISEITKYINNLRLNHLAPPLQYSDEISVFSNSWANELSNKNIFQHSNNSLYGENLATRSGSIVKDDALNNIKYSIDQWYEEIKDYDFNNPGFNPKTGHFTALVWADSKKYGMAYKYNPTLKKYVVVMNISPPGNVRNKYRENVLKSSKRR